MRTAIIYYLLLIFATFTFSCSNNQYNILNKGVTTDLARLREQQLSNIEYFIFFDIPDTFHHLFRRHFYH